MQYIQTSEETYLYSAIDGLREAWELNEIEFNFDLENFNEQEKNKNYIAQYRSLLSIEGLDKLDKNSKT